MPDNHQLQQIDDLQREYISALHRKDLGAWLACFSDQGGYELTTAENHAEGLPIALMLDDSPERLRDRIKYIERIWNGTFEDYTVRHFVQRLAASDTDGRIDVQTSFIVSYVTNGGMPAILGTGVYHDQVQITVDGPRFDRKLAVLDAPVTPRYLVYPV